MLKSAIYLNVFILLIMSIIFSIKINNKKEIKTLIIIYVVYNLISASICYSDLVEIDWDIVFLLPISIISFIIYIVNIIRINKIKEKINNGFKLFKFIIIAIIPLVIFIIPYIYELYLINNCDYLLEYNYNTGIIDSDTTYIAIVNNKPTHVTLQKNIFNREGKKADSKIYNIVYKEKGNIEISTRDDNYNKILTENEDIKKIALDAKEKNESAKSASIEYFLEKKYAIITLLSEEEYGTILCEYFYHGEKFIKSIYTNGNLSSITYYE